jgi:hypothetical protein
MKSRIAIPILAVALVVAVIFAFGALLDALGFNPGLGIARLWQAQTQFWVHFWLWVIPALVVIAAGMMLVSLRDRSRAYVPIGLTGIAVGALWLIVGFFPIMVTPLHRVGHDVRHDQISETLTTVQDEGPTFDTRPPYAFQGTVLGRSIGDMTAVATKGIWRFPVNGTQKTCALIAPSKNAFKRPMQGVVCVDDSGHVERQLFKGQIPTMQVYEGGLRLVGIVNDLIPGGTIHDSDLYGYIVDGQPFMVAPVRALSGWSKPVTIWAGALVFDTEGRVQIVHDADGSIPGPIVGESLAIDVLQALGDRAGFIQSKTAQVAYDTAAGDNASNLALDRSDGAGMRLVTLLTPRGASQTPTALLEVDMTKVAHNAWPAAVLHQFPAQPPGARPLASDREIIDTFTQLFGAQLQLQQRGLQIMEITPTTPEHVRMAIGTPNNLTAAVNVDRATREFCLTSADGAQQLGCQTPGGAATPGEGSAPPLQQLGQMSSPDLLTLLGQAIDEVKRRGLAQ